MNRDQARFDFLVDFATKHPLALGQQGGKEMRQLKQKLTGLKGNARDAAVLQDITESQRKRAKSA